MNDIVENPLRLRSLNYVSFVCRSLEKSFNFYQNVLGFVCIKRPGSFDFTGACVCECMVSLEKKLNELGIKYVRAVVQEGGIEVHQLFFHDPDGLMIEMCDCNNLPVVPLVGDTAQSCSRWNHHMMEQPQQGVAR